MLDLATPERGTPLHDAAAAGARSAVAVLLLK